LTYALEFPKNDDKKRYSIKNTVVLSEDEDRTEAWRYDGNRSQFGKLFLSFLIQCWGREITDEKVIYNCYSIFIFDTHSGS